MKYLVTYIPDVSGDVFSNTRCLHTFPFQENVSLEMYQQNKHNDEFLTKSRVDDKDKKRTGRTARTEATPVSPHEGGQAVCTVCLPSRFSSCISARLDLSYGGIKPGRLDGSRLQNAGSSVPRCSSEH